MQHSIKICVFLLFLTIVHYVQCKRPIIRQTANGPVEGFEKKTILGQTYYSFLAIPFANPPITGKDPYTGDFVDRRFKVC